MDEYYLTKEEWDGLVELGIGENTADPLLKQVKPATKTAFTRKYNSGGHPIPFHKGTDIPAARKGAKSDMEKPDLDEAFEQEIEAEPEDDVKNPDDESETIKDKLVKAKKPSATRAKTNGPAAKPKSKAEK